MIKPKDVDAYIAHAPKEHQARLEEIRSIIKSAVPQVEEKISYGMPSYNYKGRLVYFSIWATHIGIYALTAPVIEQYRDELKDYLQAKGTVALPLDEKLQVALIKKLVIAQAKENEKD